MTDLNIDQWVPEGYEFVRLDTQVKIGEYFLSATGVELNDKMDSTMLIPVIVLKKNRWRAKSGRMYWFFDETITPMSTIDVYRTYDDRRYEIGNYFKTKEDCFAVAELVKKELMK